MTRYQELMDQADFYKSEAIKHRHSWIKKTLFSWIANKYQGKARKLSIAEALKCR